jgi:hypothetical protein
MKEKIKASFHKLHEFESKIEHSYDLVSSFPWAKSNCLFASSNDWFIFQQVLQGVQKWSTFFYTWFLPLKGLWPHENRF